MSKKLRIVSVCRSLPNPDDPSGGIFVSNRLRAMARFAELTVVQPIPYMPAVRPLPAWAHAASRQLEELEIRHAPMLYVPGFLKAADGMWLARSIRATIEHLHREAAIDAIDAHFGYPEGVGCAAVARALGVPLFITVRGFENEYVGRPLVGPKMLRAMRAASGCITVSHSLHELALRHGVKPERLRVIHNAIDAAVFRYGGPSRARTSLGLEGARPLVVSVGHLISRKRHHVLIESFAEIKRDFPNALLAIIGARSFELAYPDLLIQRSRELRVADAVRFVGNTPPAAVALWLQAADVFALGTAREGCCNAVLEALGSGVPVVTTPVGDNAHFVRDGENGFIVAVDDAVALAAGIRRALERAWDRRAIASDLHGKVGSWADVGKRVIEFVSLRIGESARAVEGPQAEGVAGSGDARVRRMRTIE
jgi:glycosyltransferase involved in cell wall biosynthesis